MKKNFYTLLLTALLGMTGMNAWADTYEIATAQDLADFAAIVNGGEFTADAVMTADIDLELLVGDGWIPIGDWGIQSGTTEACYKGHFDGQGHIISGFYTTANQNYFGIFGVISTGALIENFTIYGAVACSFKTMGVVGYARDATPTIRNVHSHLNISNSAAGNRHGGILGSSVNGTVIVDRCSFSGTLDGHDSGGNGNYGGIVGYVNNNANAHLRVTNCLFDGKLINSAATPGNCTFGGMVGYVGASPDVTITNCLSIGTLQSAVTGQFYGAVKHNTCSIVNSFYQGDNINGTTSGVVTPTTQEVTEVTDAQLASGAIAFALNGSQETINWFQKLKSAVFGAQQYVVTVNGEERAPQTANATLIANGNGKYTFKLPDFVVHTNSADIPVGDVSLGDVEITNAGTFNKTGSFSVPDENIPTGMEIFKPYLQNIDYTLDGKVNDDKLYATITGISIELPLGLGTYNISVEIGEDDFYASAPTGEAYPKPFGKDIVYKNGSFYCDMTPKEGSEVIYSNSESSIIDPHSFVDGFCSVCGAFDETYMAANSDGFFEIANGNQLKWFAVYVNEVNPAVNAILTADIDLNGIEWTPIGKGVYYAGLFDGQGFTVSNLSYVGSGDCNGLFGGVKAATVRNFSVNGSLVCAGSWTGAIGRAENATISNVHSALTIETPATGVFHHAGGVVGGSYNPTTLDRCSFSGTLTVNAESHDCFGGIMGYTTDYCTIKNCINYGTVSFAKNNCYAGGIVGYVNSAACYGAHNCLNIGKVEYTGEGDPSYSGAIVGRLRGNNPALWGNSYYLEGSAVNATGENQIPTNFEVTEAQLANGEVAAKLAPYIRQNIGEDALPCLDPTHDVVAEITAAGYASLYVPDTDIMVPAGVEAYAGEKSATGRSLILNAISGSIAADEAVILKGAEGIYGFAPTTGAVKAAKNDLKGTAEDTEAAGKFVLAQPEGKEVGLYLADTGFIRAGKAYLESTGEVKVFKFVFDEDDATGISMANATSEPAENIYNVAGQRLQKMQKGINIVGSKKVLF